MLQAYSGSEQVKEKKSLSEFSFFGQRRVPEVILSAYIQLDFFFPKCIPQKMFSTIPIERYI